MIGAARYFAPRMFAPRYWPKLGDVIVIVADAGLNWWISKRRRYRGQY